MQDNDPGGFAARNVRFFRTLAVILGAGIVLSVLLTLGIGGIDIKGVFELQALTRGLLLMVFIVAAVLAMFLLRIGVIFDVERQVRDMFKSESDRFDDMHKSQAEEMRDFRDTMRRELAELREAMRKEFNQRDQMYDGAMRASNQALKAATDALARAEALSREPAYRSTIESLVGKVDGLVKDVQALRTADRVNSPLLKELQEKVVILEQGQKKLNIRVDETMEGIERRDMEQSALRATLDHELAGLKKRETLLLVKQKELESQNQNLVVKSVTVPMTFAPGEDGQHILTLGMIGPVYTSRLNAAGIITIPQLLAADARQLGPRIDAMPDLVGEWQSAAQLTRVKGITPAVAEALVKAGVPGPKHLASQTADELLVKLRDVEKSRKAKTGVELTPAVAQQWIQAAKEA